MTLVPPISPLTIPPTFLSPGLPARFSSWYPGQSEALAQIMAWLQSTDRFLCVDAPTGCHPAGQGVLMYDGTICAVEQVRIGDLLMGPDSQPRLVLALVRGAGLISEVQPVKGESWRVNDQHVLTLVRTRERYPSESRRSYPIEHGGDTVDVSLAEWRRWSKHKKHLYKLVRTGVDFPENDLALPLPAYILGMLLGDGSLSIDGRVAVTTIDHEVETAFDEYVASIGLQVRVQKFARYAAGVRTGGVKLNPIVEALRWLELSGIKGRDRFVPHPYLVASREDRLQILAGLLDTDGSLSTGVFDFLSKSSRLANDVAFLARSVGLAAYITQRRMVTKWTGRGGSIFHRVSISGSCSIIPTRIARKQATERMQIKDVLRTGFCVISTGRDEPYYGFTLDGDGRYLLDDFTITHNSGKSLLAILTAILSQRPTVILTATKGLQSQLLQDFYDVILDMRGQNNFKCLADEDGNLTVDEGHCHAGITCDLKSGGCLYYDRLRLIREAPLIVTNYAYYLAQMNYADGISPCEGNSRELLICDEAHLVFKALESFHAVRITRAEIEQIGGTYPLLELDTWAAWRAWATTTSPKADAEVTRIEAEIEDMKLNHLRIPAATFKAYRARKGLAVRLKSLYKYDTDYAWEQNERDSAWTFTPIWPPSESLFGSVPKVMLLSACITPKTATNLRIPDAQFIHVPSHFSPAKTPVKHVETVRMNARTTPEEMRHWANRIDQIIARRQDRKGIVFTVSYARRDFLLLNSIHRNIMHSHGSDDVVEMVARFKNAPAPAVLVSPSVTSGWDFPGTECQYIIVGKIPYPDTRPMVVKKRTEQDSEWSSFTAMETLVQEAGRGTRSAQDSCEVLIIDNNWTWYWPRNKQFAPEWFHERVQGSTSVVPQSLAL